MSNGTQPTVLLVEPDDALRRLLALGLRHRGMRVIDAAALLVFPPREILQAGLLLIDVDSDIASDWSLLDEAYAHPLLAALPIVALTWDARVAAPASVSDSYQTTLQERIAYIAKPFDARTLYATIDDLLLASIPQESILPQPASLAAPPASTGASIWPLITAAGLLIIIVGFMLQIAISAAGLLIVLIALLWWTLGTGKSGPRESQAPAGFV